MKLNTYEECLRLSKEAIDAVLAPLRIMKARKQAELEMAKLEEEIATLQAKIQEVCMQKEINFAALISLQDALALTERKKKQYQQILTEMFP